MLAEFVGVQVSEPTARRLTERAGAAAVAVHEAERERLEREAPPPPAGPERLLLCTDGAFVPLRGGLWAEVKTLAIGEVTRLPARKAGAPAAAKEGEETAGCQDLSYFSRLAEVERFTADAYVEVYRRGVESAGEVGAASDGAEWCQSFFDFHRPDARRILDFPHAGERVGEVGRICFGEEGESVREWTETHLHALKHEGPPPVLQVIAGLAAEHPQEKKVAENLAYLQRREEQMQYPQLREAGWPIGSGIVESANKLVVEARLKGPGMHWARAHVNSMLALRNGECNGRWEETWRLASQHQRRQRDGRLRRGARPTLPERANPGAASPGGEVSGRPGGVANQNGPGSMLTVLPDRTPPAAERTSPPQTRRPHPWRRYNPGWLSPRSRQRART